MKHGSLFSGIGGFDLAAEWMGWENVFHCENNTFCQKILKHYWPNAISYGDITKTDFSIHRGQIDIVTGGFPCQPFSSAGKRKGTKDDRHLWPEMLRTIREIQPQWIVGENVFGIINWSGGMVFEQVQSDLEAEGYESQAYVLPACATNAPHRRNRVWFVAHSNRQRSNGNENEVLANKRHNAQHDTRQGVVNRITSNPNGLGRKGGIKGLQATQRQGYDSSYSSERELRNSWERDDLPAPTIIGMDDGLPEDLDRIKALGNAVVPQVVYEIFKAIAA